MSSRKKTGGIVPKKSKIFSLLLFSFFITDIFAYSIETKKILEVLPGAEQIYRRDEPLPYYEGYNKEGNVFIGIAFVTSEVCPDAVWGFRSKISTLIGVNKEGKIVGIKILSESEDNRYTKGLLKEGSWFINQFIGKSIRDTFAVGKDIDAISGATISSTAFIHSIHKGLYLVSNLILNARKETFQEEPVQEEPVKFASSVSFLTQVDFLVLFIIGLALYGYIMRKKFLRYITLAFSIVYIGFIKGGGASISDVVRIFRFEFPVFSNNFYWYSLWIVIILSLIFLGRFYCGWLCPFGGIQEVLHRINPLKVLVSFSADKYVRLIKYLNLTIILVIAFLAKNINLANNIAAFIEPFATFFKISGVRIVWIYLGIIIIASFLIPRCYCRYFCPLGAFFAFIDTATSSTKLKMARIELPEKNNCKGCKIASKVCHMGGICYEEKEGRASLEKSECIKCNECKFVCPAIWERNELS